MNDQNVRLKNIIQMLNQMLIKLNIFNYFNQIKYYARKNSVQQF